MQVVIGGASGFLGTALTQHLRQRGHQVTRLVRSADSADDASVWDPYTGRIDQIVIDRADAVVNLSGASVARWPRTAKHRKLILESRTAATGTLAKAVAASPNPPALISASGMSYYGVDCGDEVLVVAREGGRGAASGAPVSSQNFMVLTFRDGKILRYREFYDESAALEAVGMSELPAH